MPLEPCFEQALNSANPAEELRRLAERLSSQGHDRAAVLTKFDEARAQLREDARENDEDLLMDIMDRVAGWCAPNAEIPPRVPQANGAAAPTSDTNAPRPRISP
jgi:hypothetical protein